MTPTLLVRELPFTGVRTKRDGAVRGASAEQVAQLVSTIYDRIEVRGLEFVAAHLTATAMAHGLALALPEQVSRYWRPRQDSNLRPSA